ncbi:hypothetical protein [Streptomyces sp. NPDC046685]|uniref:hypothetical protein n=1 Tax=Streptomyces sp. NPDC046685 TaxID=3157202 RepID=UPI0033E77963
MGQGLTEELRRDLQELDDNARYVEAYINHLVTELRNLQSAATRARSSLTDNASANDVFRDNTRELIAMKYEIGRLADRVTNMVTDCESY